MRNELLRLKRIYNLPDEITEHEQKLLDQGMPVQKIIGFVNFDDLPIYLTFNVLIPRYETQEVVNKALEFVGGSKKVLDLCAGSGYIGLTIKHKRPHANVTLSDLSNDAISQCRENADLNNLDVTIIKSDLFANIKEKFDVIVCNPPYIPEGTPLDQSVLNFEPHDALFAGKDGNKFYKQILSDVDQYLNPNGVVVFEISPDNSSFLRENGFEIFLDINNKERIAVKKF